MATMLLAGLAMCSLTGLTVPPLLRMIMSRKSVASPKTTPLIMT